MTWIVIVVLIGDKKVKGGIFLSFFSVFLFMVIGTKKDERIKKVVLTKTVKLIEKVSVKSSKDPSKLGFYETPIPEILKNRKQNS